MDSVSRKPGKLARILIKEIKYYQREISPEVAKTCRCRFTPTCSHYASEALKRHGVIYGSLLSAWRVSRCNSLSRGGEDPVPQELLKYFPRNS